MGRSLRPLVTVGVGGAIGALVRWALLALGPEDASDLILLAVNVLGSLLLGLILGQREHLSDRWRLGLGTGFAGGLTTFSGYAVAVAGHLDDGALLTATGTGLGTPVATLVAAGIGFRATRIHGARPVGRSGRAPGRRGSGRAGR